MRSALANQLGQRTPPRIRFLLMQESTAERVALECVAAQIVGKVLEPSHLLAQQELDDHAALESPVDAVLHVGECRLQMGETEP
jgi:hypothetical protein